MNYGGNYLYTFLQKDDENSIFGEILSQEEEHQRVKSAIGEEPLEFLWNLYQNNKDFIKSEVIRRYEEAEERLKKEEEAYKEDCAKRVQEWKQERDSYYFSSSYSPPKNSIPVFYKGKSYKSKKQCCYCENISMTELNKYLNLKK